MDVNTEELKKRENQIESYRSKDLILTINVDWKIIKFNKECEKISGYSLDFILYKNFFDILIPARYLEQWKRIINYILENKEINDFRLPLLTKHGHEIMVSWSSFPIGQREPNISLVGKLVTSWDAADDIINIPLKNGDNRAKDFIDLDKIIKELTKRNNELEKKNKELEKKLKDKTPEHRDLMGSGLYSISDIVGGKKRMEEIEALIKELDEREKQVTKLLYKLNKDKKKVNDRRNEFIEWRKKLELLEMDLEHRNKELLRQEKLLDECFLIEKKDSIQRSKSVKELEVDFDPLEGIQESAAVIQRGILKQVNLSFTKLLGLVADDIVDKSIFDFISPDSFSPIENYYFKRLKGEDITTFKTVIFTNYDTNVMVKVTTRPTIYHGEKAEVAIFTKVS